MKTIAITKGKAVLVDDGDYGWLSRYSWVARPHHTGTFYAQGRYNGRLETMHRVIMGCEPFDGKVVDHINHDTLDNRRSNLRVCNREQNARNRIRNRRNVAGFKGVYFANPKRKGVNRPAWRAVIYVNKKLINLGRFATPELAAKAYDEAAIKYHGDFALTNTPSPTA